MNNKCRPLFYHNGLCKLNCLFFSFVDSWHLHPQAVVGIEAHLKVTTHEKKTILGTTPTTNEEKGQRRKGNKERGKRSEKARSGGLTCWSAKESFTPHETNDSSISRFSSVRLKSTTVKKCNKRRFFPSVLKTHKNNSQ